MDCYRLPCWTNRRQPTGFGVGVSSISSKWPQFSHLPGCGWWHFMLLPSNPILRVAATGLTTHAGPPREYAKRGSRKIQFSTQQQRYKKRGDSAPPSSIIPGSRIDVSAPRAADFVKASPATLKRKWCIRVEGSFRKRALYAHYAAWSLLPTSTLFKCNSAS